MPAFVGTVQADCLSWRSPSKKPKGNKVAHLSHRGSALRYTFGMMDPFFDQFVGKSHSQHIYRRLRHSRDGHI